MNPNVTAVIITRNRPAFREKALKCVYLQSYEPKNIVVLDTSDSVTEMSVVRVGNCVMAYRSPGNLTVGDLRNMAIRLTTRDTEIVVHFDDDDWSHPNRTAEQVALLQSSGADAVGYREMLFWRQPYTVVDHIPDARTPYFPRPTDRQIPGEAWLYSNPDPRYCLGTSLCYWRRTWERVPFQALPKTKGGHAEDNEWLKSVRSLGTLPFGNESPIVAPRMVARIHSSNTSDYASVVGKSHNWRRVPEWDAYCRSVME